MAAFDIRFFVEKQTNKQKRCFPLSILLQGQHYLELYFTLEEKAEEQIEDQN